MSANRSEDYYLESGNIVLQIENTLFKVHRDILMLHSGFFKDMLSMPIADEGLGDEHPLLISQDLCSSNGFETICRFMYPKKIGKIPGVSLGDFGEWEPVLKASESLQFNDMQEYVLSQLQRHTIRSSSHVVRLLYWALRAETKFDSLVLKCLGALVYRRRPLSEAEMITLGSKTAMQIIHIRERLRMLFLSRDLLVSKWHAPYCEKPTSCPSAAVQWFMQGLSEEGLAGVSDNADIFQISLEVPDELCPGCKPRAKRMVECLKWALLDERIQQWARELRVLPPRSSSQ